MLDDGSLVSRLRSSTRGSAKALQAPPDASSGCGGLSLRCRHRRGYFLCAGSPKATDQGQISFSLSRSGSNDEMFTRLTDYARSIETDEPASMAAAGKPLPDVNPMIERLTVRLETTPEDIEGWRMLGWSYFRTARYEQAATAYARAVELDPIPPSSSSHMRRPRRRPRKATI